MFEDFVALAPETKFTVSSKSFFTTYSLGLNSNRDIWAYNFASKALAKNCQKMTETFNQQVEQYKYEKSKKADISVEQVITTNPSLIKWSSSLIPHVARGTKAFYSPDYIRIGLYRPFCRQHLYQDPLFIHRMGNWTQLFPTPQTRNLVICCSGIGVTKEFSCIITDIIPDLELIGKSQCFPLYYYEKQDKQRQGEFDFGDGQKNEDDNIRRDGISDFILKRCKELNPKISKEDIFYYVYGLLHSPDYRQRFSADLKKSLPHIPLPEEYALFKAFQTIGRKLADIHLNYETYPMCQDVLVQGENSGNFHVEKMRFISKEDKRTIIFNDCIQIENVPLKAYEYVLNGKSAIEWIMERYAITTDKASGIVNDPNQWSDNPRYILELLLRIIQVSVDTVDLVAQLPHWEF